MPRIRATSAYRVTLHSTASVAFVIVALSVPARGQAGNTIPPPAGSPPAAGAVTTPTGPVAPSYFAGEGDVPQAPRVVSSVPVTITESLFGDVYAEGRWRPLALNSFFSEGWLEPWAGAPAGRTGLTPRHGWLGGFDGVFYRLWLTTFGYTNTISTSYRGDRYAGNVAVFLPFSRRFEVLIDAPFLASNGTRHAGTGYATEFGDLTVTPRFLLAESEASSHIFALAVRTPTGSKTTGNDVAALTPRYEFWTNPRGSWVARGSGGFFIPVNKGQTPAHTAVTGGLALGRYFTPHDVPFGDLVVYAACNFSVPLDGASSSATVVSVGPGTRFHIGKDYFFLNYWDFPVTGPHPDTFGVQFALLKVF